MVWNIPIKKAILSLIFLNLSVISQLEAQEVPQKMVAVLGFYNLENLFDTINDPEKNDEDFLPSGNYHYTGEVYQKKLINLSGIIDLLGKEVNSDGVAILGVSEVENKQVLKDLVRQEALAEERLRIVHFESHDSRGIDNALLYNPKYFRVLGARPLYVQVDGKEYITRSILWVHGQLLGEPIDVFVNHWPSRRGGESATAYLRDSAAAVVRHTMDSLLELDPQARFVVMGDMNDDPTNESIAEILNARGEKKEVTDAHTMYNPFYKFYKAGMGTTAYRDAWSLFDQIILGKYFLSEDPQQWNYLSAQVFKKRFMQQKFGHFKGYPLRSFSNAQWIGGYSDHFPVLVYLLKNMDS